ncbi:orotidine-5'-phosphate decarboxylase [Corynebacterium sp. HMSC04H06]|uniref:orotidine-5'-phosphate decarboxylase n=1 Tax=Corynebacterium sp. HMSC04H06 TaxID=1581050 RepID=UPI0008A5542E|nr:orotidine-5'-phosphate decarboxylase [Corynebacterium sp. HMSC04H06]OFS22572.1 orotidine 5'-phosphate decarboxylase [Corynebacterium sp. HMSC04H06]
MPQSTSSQQQPVNPGPGFGERLVAAGQERGRLCVGIDPHPYLLKQWGLGVDAVGVREFSRRCVEAFAPVAALVKPQVAFYERFGSAGLAALEETLSGLREAGCLSVADAKRGDIGSTMAGYADAWMGEDSPLRADAVTLSPYLGVGALEPAFAAVRATGRGIFVLAATSNPEARRLQGFQEPGSSRTVAQSVVDACAERNATDRSGQAGDIGVVVGATLDTPPELGQLNGPVLLPGVGAQGAGPEQVRAIVAGRAELGFANVSRAILERGPKVDDLRKAVEFTAAEFRD